MFSARTAHRTVGYFEEEAYYSYSEHPRWIDNGVYKNAPALIIALTYWNLPEGAWLRDAVLAAREEEAGLRDVNHGFADQPSSNRFGAAFLAAPALHLRRKNTISLKISFCFYS